MKSSPFRSSANPQPDLGQPSRRCRFGTRGRPTRAAPPSAPVLCWLLSIRWFSHDRLLPVLRAQLAQQSSLAECVPAGGSRRAARSVLHVTAVPWRTSTSCLLLLLPATPVLLLSCASPRWCCAVCQELVQMCRCSARVMNSVFKYADEIMTSPRQLLSIAVFIGSLRGNAAPVDAT